MKKKGTERQIASNYNLDSLLTAEIRFFIMTLSAMYEEVDFNFLKSELEASDGNLSVNLSKLEEAEYLTTKKEFVGKKPKTSYKITKLGLDRLSLYINKIDSFKKVLAKKEQDNE